MPVSARSRPALIAGLLFVVGLVALVGTGRWLAGGTVAYPLDDTYIHLAVARTLSEFGTWGVNPGELASASSSPGWTMLVAAGFALAGPRPGIALALNIAAAWGVVAVAGNWLHEAAVSRASGWLVALVALVPLPFLAGLGLEHTLHLLLVLLLVRAETPVRLGLLAAAATSVRYETVFVVAGLAIPLVRAGRWPEVGVSVGASAAVILGLGAWWVSAGGTFLPAGVLLKADPGRALIGNLREGMGIVVLMGVAGGLARHRAIPLLIAGTGLFVLGRVGWFYRYEAWLVAWAVLVIATAPRRRWSSWMVALALLVAAPRAVEACRRFPFAMRFVADADLAVAAWLSQRHAGETVGVHNLGAVAWAGDVGVVDVAGLGTPAITRAIAGHTLTPETLGALLAQAGAHFVVGGPEWRSGAPPPEAREVATLWVPFPVPPGDYPAVVVWSLDRTMDDALAAELAAGPWSSRVRVVWPAGSGRAGPGEETEKR